MACSHRRRCGLPHYDQICTAQEGRESGGSMNSAIGRWFKAGALLFIATLIVAACPGPAGLPGQAGEPGKPGEPGKAVPLGPVAVGTIPALELMVEGTATVDLNAAFNEPEGETLTFDAKSASLTIATTAADPKGILTVTGVAVGKTKVTVIAKDPGGLQAKQTFGVTVTAKPPPPKPPVTIEDVKKKYPYLVITPATAADVSEEIELPADHTLMSGNPAVVTVAKKSADTSASASSIRWAAATADTSTKNVWVVTAVAMGATDVDVLDKSGAPVHTIRVRVTIDPPAKPMEPDDPDDPDEEKFDYTLDVDKTAVIQIQKGQFVHSSDEGVVEVRTKTATSVEIVARSKGMADVTVYNEAGEEAKEYKVKVNNRPPKRTKEKPSKFYDLTSTDAPDEIEERHSLTMVYAIQVDLGSLYEDPDGAEDLVFTARSVNRTTAVVAGVDSDGSQIYVDVLNGTAQEFHIIVEVKDKDKASAPVIRLKVRNDDPLAQMYEAHQRSSGTINTVRVTYRKLLDGVFDTVKFVGETPITNSGVVASRLDSGFLFTGSLKFKDATATAAEADFDAATATESDAPSDDSERTAEVDWYAIDGKGSKMTLGDLMPKASTDTEPHVMELGFRAKTSSDRHTVTVTYHVIETEKTNSVDELVQEVEEAFVIDVSPVVEDPVTVE